MLIALPGTCAFEIESEGPPIVAVWPMLRSVADSLMTECLTRRGAPQYGGQAFYTNALNGNDSTTLTARDDQSEFFIVEFNRADSTGEELTLSSHSRSHRCHERGLAEWPRSDFETYSQFTHMFKLERHKLFSR